MKLNIFQPSKYTTTELPPMEQADLFNVTDWLMVAFREYEKETEPDSRIEWHADFLDFVMWLVTDYKKRVQR